MYSPSSIRYLHESRLAFIKVDDNIYRVSKNRDQVGYKLGSYVSSSPVIDAMNNIEKVLIHTEKQHLVHANFALSEDE